MTKIRMDREEAALRELGVTRAGQRTRWILILGFLVTIFTVPVLQSWRDCTLSKPGQPSALNGLITAFPHAASAGTGAISCGLFPAISSADRSLKEELHEVEKSLEKESLLTHRFLPKFQWFASKYLNLGNEKVFLGRDGWLYYRPDVDYLTAGAFPVTTKVSGVGSIGRQCSPIPAIKAFRDDLAKRNITLLVMPVPVKPMIEPEHLLIDSPKEQTLLQNTSYTAFVEELRSQGVEVMDLTNLLLQRKHSTGVAQYLERDTHWTPDAMEAVADFMVQKIQALSPADSSAASNPPSQSMVVHQAGDLTGMLDLPKSEPLFPDQEVSIRPFRSPDGGHWKPDPSSPVLLLGDSFSRIFSAEDLNWGRDAGLAERLSEKLGRNIDVLAINAGGSSSVRQSLARSPDRLNGKKVVLYEFSMRDLSGGDWKVIPIPEAGVSSPKTEHPKEGLTVTGVIAEISEIPPPGSTPYKDFVRSFHLKEVEGTPSSDLLVFVQAIRKGKSTGAETLQAGKRLTLHLIPWEKVEAQVGSMNRSELQGSAAELQDVYWSDEY
jgi:alginate O-acetyltransferase complex protein AlgJ